MMPVSTKMSKKTKTIIHPSSVISPEAMIGEGVEIGPFCVVGPQVRIGRDTRLFSHIHIDGDVEIGERCKIYPGVVLGMPAQARSLDRAARTGILIGHDNVLREYVTVHTALKDSSKTVIGDRNILMAYVHVAHDCVIGNDTTIANSVALAGHVEVADRVVIGGLVGVHQFVRIGTMAIVGALSKVVMDIPPFSTYDGHPASFHGVNAIGLKRAGYTASQLARIKKLLVALFGERVNISSILPALKKEHQNNADAQIIFDFIQKSKRGIGRAASQDPEQD